MFISQKKNAEIMLLLFTLNLVKTLQKKVNGKRIYPIYI